MSTYRSECLRCHTTLKTAVLSEFIYWNREHDAVCPVPPRSVTKADEPTDSLPDAKGHPKP